MMRGLVLVICIVLVSAGTSCILLDDTSLWPERSEGIRGSGKLVTETRTLPYFHSVHISTAGKVYVTQGPGQAVSVTADDNVLEYITTSVIDGRLVIGVEHGVRLSNFTLRLNLTMKDLQELSTSSAGSIIGRNRFEADNVRLASSSAGDIRLDLEANEVRSLLSSAGDFFLRGNVETHEAVLTSAGDLHAFDLITNVTRITVSSAGDAEVFATDLLDVTINSVGSVFYKGHPQIRLNISSLGRLVDSN